MRHKLDKWTYCDCAGSHKPGCPNADPGGLPPLADDDDCTYCESPS